MSKTVLTEANKKRIKEEEKYRTEVRKGLGETSKQKPKGRGTGCLVAIIVFIALGVICNFLFSPSNDSSSSPVTERDFKASVRFTGTQFVITNLDSLDCQNAKMEVNAGLVSGGYALDGYVLKAGEVYTVGVLQFTKGDGTRLNTYQVKPKTFSIYCSRIGSTNALGGAGWYGEFK